jgi:hypothetical protein
MKRILVLVSIIAIGFFGYRYYKANKLTIPTAISSRIPSTPVRPNTDFLSVLGTSTSDIVARGTELLNHASGGKAEPIINKAVSDLQDRVKDLPAEEYKKVKYEFCKDVFPSPSPVLKN